MFALFFFSEDQISLYLLTFFSRVLKSTVFSFLVSCWSQTSPGHPRTASVYEQGATSKKKKKQLQHWEECGVSFFFFHWFPLFYLGRKWTVSHFQHTVLLLSFFVKLLILRCCMHLWRRRPMSAGWKKKKTKKKTQNNNNNMCTFLSFFQSRVDYLGRLFFFFFYCYLFIVCDLFNFLLLFFLF